MEISSETRLTIESMDGQKGLAQSYMIKTRNYQKSVIFYKCQNVSIKMIVRLKIALFPNLKNLPERQANTHVVLLSSYFRPV